MLKLNTSETVTLQQCHFSTSISVVTVVQSLQTHDVQSQVVLNQITLLYWRHQSFPKMQNMSCLKPELWGNVYKIMHKTSRIFPFDGTCSHKIHGVLWLH